jgi:hypothetical protein
MSLDPLTFTNLWLRIEPVKKFRAWRAKRRGKLMAVETGLRSSSNMVLAGAATNIIVEIVQALWPEFVLSPENRTYLTLGIAWVASRFTKTPAAPKVL